MPTKIAITPDVEIFLQYYGARVFIEGEDNKPYFHLPYWIGCEEGKTSAILYKFDELPEELKHHINERREKSTLLKSIGYPSITDDESI